jgi:hypothetical protein
MLRRTRDFFAAEFLNRIEGRAGGEERSVGRGPRTGENHLRHSKFIGLREDKAAKNVSRE